MLAHPSIAQPSLTANSGHDHDLAGVYDCCDRRAFTEVELLDRVTGDDGDDPSGTRDDDLYLGEETVEADLGDGARQAIASGVDRPHGIAAQPLDFSWRDLLVAAIVPLDLDVTRPIPATKRVVADTEQLGCLARRVV